MNFDKFCRLRATSLMETHQMLFQWLCILELDLYSTINLFLVEIFIFFSVSGLSSKEDRTADIINILVKIYGSQDMFVSQYRVLLADRILTNFSYDITNEVWLLFSFILTL